MRTLWTIMVLVVTMSCSSDRKIQNSSDGIILDRNPIPYNNLTEKEHVITNLELCVESRNIEKYRELYHTEYEFIVGKYRSSRNREMSKMQALFDANSEFTMQFYDGEWKELAEYEGVGCKGCWETLRTYDKNIFSDDEGLVTITNHARIIITPVVEEEITKYKIYKVVHIRKEDYNSALVAWRGELHIPEQSGHRFRTKPATHSD